jgi:hypothetical protein
LEIIKIIQRKLGGCHNLLLIYDAPQLSAAYVVKSPVLGLQSAFFQKNYDFFAKLKISQNPFCKKIGNN